MIGKQVKLSNWPYSKDKIATLTDISKPYMKENKYWVEIKFLPNLHIKYERPFTDYSLLFRGEKYLDGIYIQGLEVKTTTLQLIFNEEDKPEPYLYNKKNTDECFYYNTFSFKYQSKFYVLPLDIILRDVLAPDAEMLNLLLSLDMKETKFLNWIENGTLYIDVMSELPYKYSKDNSKMYYIAWIFSNPNIESMLAQTYENIHNGNGILFDWGFENLNCEVVFQENDSTGTRFIKRIIHITKRIKAQEIVMNDSRDGVHEGEIKRELNKNRIVTKSADELITSGSGKIVDLSDWSPSTVNVEYEALPKLIRTAQPSRKPYEKINYSNKVAKIGNGQRTTCDQAGEKTAPKLIFKQHDSLNDNISDFSEISEALYYIQDDKNVEKVESYIAKISLHIDTGMFRYLDDGITERCYFAGKITFKDGKEAVVLELQREEKKISMLMLISNSKCEWGGIIHEIIKHTVDESGKWPTDTLLSLYNSFYLRTDRCKHTNIGYRHLSNKILKKCYIPVNII